jgi:gas vesicle protein
MSDNTGKTVLALLAGVAIGAGIGILFAPDKGTKTREKIKEGFDDKKDEFKDKFDGFTNTIKSKFASTKMDLESSFDDLVANVDNKTEDVIASLEKKLQELKKAAATTQKQ